MHHADRPEAWLAFAKKGFEGPGLSYDGALEEALCSGGIDSRVRRWAEEAYPLRFSPRRPTSSWTSVNLPKARSLVARGRMRPAGRQRLPKDSR